MPDKSHLDELIEEFLEEHRECGNGNGYALITNDDLSVLRDIIYELLERKCDLDADGDLPVQVKLINRRIFEPTHFHDIPYHEYWDDDHETATLVSIRERLRLMAGNVRTAADRLDTEIQCFDFEGKSP